MFNRFSELYDTKKIKDYFPKHPLEDEKNHSLTQIFFSINSHLFSTQIHKGHISRLIVLSSKWMLGEPIALMIDNLVQYKTKKSGKNPLINPCVRQVLEWVEEDIRFKLMIRVKCYIDILTYFTNIHNISQPMPPLHLFLEMGASQETMISLMGIGLSRPTARTLLDIIGSKTMNEVEAYTWLENNKSTLKQRGITGVALAEIKKFVEIKEN